MVGDEAQGLEAWLRVAPSATSPNAWPNWRRMTDSPLVGALADHARAVVASDAEALLEVSERFAADGGVVVGRRGGAAAAADLLERRHQAQGGHVGRPPGDDFAERCEGGGPPASTSPPAPGPAHQARAGGGDPRRHRPLHQEIAERMYLSPRTVENHLHHAYVKLGVTDRAALAAALGTRQRR